jgi:peptidoglycan/xylan/chitin deacetylase (PgdA/CDA1 family)
MSNLLLRIGSVLRRFGISPRMFELKLRTYHAITSKFHCVPTLPLTAVTLKRHPKLIRKFVGEGIEFMVHGYIHTDYKQLSKEEQLRHFRKAIDVFQDHEIPFTGFRAPFLRENADTSKVLHELSFLYNSSNVIHWDVLRPNEYSGQGGVEYRRLLKFYNSRNAKHYLSLPRMHGGLVEIPVSMPDDEAMVDRLSIRRTSTITRIWQEIFGKTYDRGELFTIQLHPERINYYETALEQILKKATNCNPPVWIASLGEIADWWREKEKVSLEISLEGEGRYRVKATCPDESTLLLKNCATGATVAKWMNGYHSTVNRDFVIYSPVRPVIGIHVNTAPAAVSFLRGEGFIVERSERPADYGIYIDDLADFQIADEKRVIERIENADIPLIRHWRWPRLARSALAVTGDIDAVTLFDFAMRLLEIWQQNGISATSLLTKVTRKLSYAMQLTKLEDDLPRENGSRSNGVGDSVKLEDRRKDRG